MRKQGGVIMKRTILVLCAVSALIVAQDAAGQYKLTGVDVQYTYITRAENVLTVTDAYGMGITQAIAVIPAAVPFTTQEMRLTKAELAAIGINLNVTLNEDGSGSIAEGSYYPDVNTIHDENGNCVTLQQVLPVTDAFTYASMGNGMATYGFAHPGINVLGLPGISSHAGQQLGLLGLSGSNTFEDYPMVPSNPTLCGPDGSCFPFTVGDIDGSGTLEIYPDLNLFGITEYVPGGAPLTGLTGGFFLDDQCNDDGSGCNATDLTSVFPGNIDPDFILEWHGVDGISAGLGCGSEEADCTIEPEGGWIDEDGDGTWWDRELGIPAVTASYMNPACGFTQPIFGDVTAAFEAAGMGFCVDYVDVAASGYLMDPSGALATWGNFLTANAAQFSGCLAATGGDMAFCAGTYPGWLADDSDHDFNGVDGRLTMNFDIPCVGIIEAREVIAEFIEVGNSGCGTGDMNADGGFNVLDVVALVNCVLSELCDNCAGDMNNDGGYNVLDVVALVNCVLADTCAGARVDAATSAEFNVIGNEVTMIADGIVGGVQMTLSHGSDFALKLTDGGQFSDYSTEGNTTTLIIVNPANNNLFTTSGDFTIESVIVSDFTGENRLSASVNMPGDFSISAAYPNPFNPTTQMTLALHTQADVSVKVFNMAGQLVDVIAEGQMDKGSYSLTWDAANVSSGVYFIKTEVGSVVQNQKIMLIK